MPKRIENLKENILQHAKETLLTEGYGALTIRGVAHGCGIAVGTVYNYFPAKDVLAAAVMLEDWTQRLHEMQDACRRAQSVECALTALYTGVSEFSGVYRAVWAGYTFSGGFRSAFDERHRMLVSQLADCLSPTLTRLGVDGVAETAVFLAENVLICTGNSAMTFDGFLRIAERILS